MLRRQLTPASARRRTIRHPGVVLELRTGNPQFLASAVLAGELNAALVGEPIADTPFDKTYSDTRARGQSKFDRVIAAVPALAARDDGAQWLRRLTQSALADEEGTMLDGALKTIATL